MQAAKLIADAALVALTGAVPGAPKWAGGTLKGIKRAVEEARGVGTPRA